MGRHSAMTPVHTVYARHIGRVGALAVALGVGAAVVTSPGVAWAEEPGASSPSGTESGANDAGESGDRAGSPSPNTNAPNTSRSVRQRHRCRTCPRARWQRIDDHRHGGDLPPSPTAAQVVRSPPASPVMTTRSRSPSRHETASPTADPAPTGAPAAVSEPAAPVPTEPASSGSDPVDPTSAPPKPADNNDTAHQSAEATAAPGDEPVAPQAHNSAARTLGVTANAPAPAPADPTGLVPLPNRRTRFSAAGRSADSVDRAAGQRDQVRGQPGRIRHRPVLQAASRRARRHPGAVGCPGLRPPTVLQHEPSLVPTGQVADPTTGQLYGNVGATDADGDPLTYTVLEGPAHGTITINAAGTYTYTPEQGYVGTDSFTVAVSDNLGSARARTGRLVQSRWGAPGRRDHRSDGGTGRRRQRAADGDGGHLGAGPVDRRGHHHDRGARHRG